MKYKMNFNNPGWKYQDQRYINFLADLQRKGKIVSIPDSKVDRVFEKMAEELAPLIRESRLQQALSEKASYERGLVLFT